MQNRSQGFWLIIVLGAMCVAASAIAVHHFHNSTSRTIFTGFVGLYAGGVLLKIGFDRATPEPMAVLRLSTLRRTKAGRFRTRKRAVQRTPQFFRAPPCFVDFQRHYIVDHPLVGQIEQLVKLNHRGVALIEGPPASGKSVLLRTIEFRLTRGLRGSLRRVYSLSCKELEDSEAQSVATDIRDRVPRGSVVLIDDLHLHLLRLAPVMDVSQSRDVVLVLVTRPLSNYPAAHYRPILDLQPRRYTTSAQMVADSIVGKFTRTELNLALDANQREIYRPYVKDLWLLSTALKATSIDGESLIVSRAAIDLWVREHIVSDDRPAVASRKDLVVAVLASLYRFEVPVAYEYLVKKLGVDAQFLEKLVREGEVITSGVYLGLHHSSLADLVLAALSGSEGLQTLPDAVARISLLGSGAHWYEEVAADYVLACPHHGASALARLSRSSTAGRDLALRVVRVSGVADSIHSGVVPTRVSVELVGWLARLWKQSRIGVPPFLKDAFEAMARSEGDDSAAAWAWATASLEELERGSGVPFAEQLALLLVNAPVELAAGICTTVSYASKRAAEIAVSRITAAGVSQQLMLLEPFTRTMTLAKLIWVDPRLGTTLATLSEVVVGASPTQVSRMVARLAWGCESYTQDLVRKTALAHLTDIAHRLVEVDQIGLIEFAGIIGHLNSAQGLDLVDAILDAPSLAPSVRSTLAATRQNWQGSEKQKSGAVWLVEWEPRL